MENFGNNHHDLQTSGFGNNHHVLQANDIGNNHHDLQTNGFGNTHHDLQTNGFGNTHHDLQANGFENTHHDLQTNGFGNNHHVLQTNGFKNTNGFENTHHDLQTNGCEIVSPLNLKELRRQGHMMIDFIVDYYENIEKYPVLSQVELGYLQKRLPESAPDSPEPIETILQDIQKHIIPGLTHWQSPNFFAYFSAGVSVAGFLGDALMSAFNVVGFSWVSSPAATELESIVMDWLGKMLQLPQSFLFSGNGGGVIHGTTCEAVLCTLVAARDQYLRKNGREKVGKLVVYASDQTHSTVQKAATILGINFRIIKTTKSTSFSLSPEALQNTIIQDLNAGLIPLYLCATVGTTSTCAVDPIGPLCDVAKEHDIWVHVDAAHAGSACICPEFRHFLDGIEGVNSFSLNAHKWLFTNAVCCCLWVKDPSALTKSLTTNPEYLTNKATESSKVVDYKDWQIPLTRRFRAMKLWLVLRSYGVTNLRNFLRKHVNMAKLFEQLVRDDTRFEVVFRRKFALVCFRVRPAALGVGGVEEECANEFNKKLLEKINETGEVFMTHAKVGGVFMIRCSIGTSLTEEKHVINAWKVVQHMATAIQLPN